MGALTVPTYRLTWTVLGEETGGFTCTNCRNLFLQSRDRTGSVCMTCMRTLGWCDRGSLGASAWKLVAKGHVNFGDYHLLPGWLERLSTYAANGAEAFYLAMSPEQRERLATIYAMGGGQASGALATWEYLQRLHLELKPRVPPWTQRELEAKPG
jgi:hypothetical protein